MQCNICGHTEFGQQGTRLNVRCLKCNSLERTRAIQLHLQQRSLPHAGAKMLHIAPEKGLAGIFENVMGRSYDPVDLFPELFPHCKARKFDLCRDAETLEEESYDLVLHSHVLEHIPCNWTMVLLFLHRALKKGGLHLFSFPVMPGAYDETLGSIGEEQCVRRFGQKDHVRRFGRMDIERTVGMLFKGDLMRHALGNCFSDDALDAANIPLVERNTLNGSTVFVFGKDDVRLTF